MAKNKNKTKNQPPKTPKNRRSEHRQPNTQHSTQGHIAISWRYFQNTQSEFGQTLAEWAEAGLLKDMFETFHFVTSNHITDLQIKFEKLTLYGEYPDSSVCDFPLPLRLSAEENWGVIRNIGGQKARIAGFLRGDFFYIVYLDKNHRFFKSSKN